MSELRALDKPTAGRVIIRLLAGFVLLIPVYIQSQSRRPEAAASKEKIVIDTDIGDDIDDAFAVALALRSPELQILAISTTFGDTATRAKLLDRLLGEAGREYIPVAVGKPGPTASLPSAVTPRAGTLRAHRIPRPSISYSRRSVTLPAKSLSSPSGRCSISAP